MGARRRLLLVALVAFAGAVLPAAAGAGTGLFVGADEDAFLWGGPQPPPVVARSLGLKAFRVTVQWRPGESRVSSAYEQLLGRALIDSWGLRPVVSVYGSAGATPRTDAARVQYCDFVADLLRKNPTVNDVVIWNDPNDGAFWSPQFNADGSSAAPYEYEALLARCWSTLHAARPAVNVVALSTSRSAGGAGAFAAAWHPPAAWYRALGAAYRSSGDRFPLFDTVGHIPHPLSSAERPWTRHGASGPIGEGDYDELTRALAEAFGGTAQPLPGRGPVSIWYLAQGFQTAPDPGKASLYGGRETDLSPVPAWSPAAASDTRAGPAPDQATQLADAVRVAYCQPNVGAFFNFHLADEANLAGWQSGVLWADWSPKPSYSALKRAVAEVNARTIDCAAVSPEGAPPLPVSVPPPAPELQISGLRAASVSPFSATIAWRTTIPAAGRIAYGLLGTGETLWAGSSGAAVEHQATLPGLSVGTPYRARVTVVSEDGQRAQGALDLRTPTLPSSVTASVGKPAGALLLDGQPFFPLMVWSQCPYAYGPNLASGINLFAENPCGGLQEQLDGLAGRALSAAVAGKPGGSGAGLIGFFYPDEADGLGLTGATLPPPPAGAPGLGFLTLTNHFYSGAAPLPQGRGMYPDLIAKPDVVGFDLFPLQEWCAPDRLGDVFAAQRELVKLAAKPTFQWIEAAEWKCPGGRTAVTPATVRAEAWLAVAGGAHGLGFFPATWAPGVDGAVAGISRDIAKLGPALLSPPVPVDTGNPHVKAGARSHQGALYVVAVNAGYSATRVTIRVPGLGGRPLDVLDEGRRLGATGDSFSDSFAPLAVHIYVAAPADA